MEIVYTGGSRRPVWLTTPAEIEPHLVFLAVEIGSVSVTVDSPLSPQPAAPAKAESLVLHGRIGVPSIARFLPFEIDPSYSEMLLPPGSQTAIRVDYQAWDDSYTFHTRVVGVDAEGRWLLMPPRAIERGDRRIVYRHRVLGDPAFKVSLEGPWQPKGEQPFTLFDISTDGLGFLFDPSHHPLGNGEVLAGHLDIGDTLSMPVLLRVAHTRPFKESAMEWVAGCRFLDLGLEHRMDLARSITLWEIKRLKES